MCLGADRVAVGSTLSDAVNIDLYGMVFVG